MKRIKSCLIIIAILLAMIASSDPAGWWNWVAGGVLIAIIAIAVGYQNRQNPVVPDPEYDVRIYEPPSE